MRSELFFTFMAGAVAGAVTTYLLIEDRLSRRLDEELEAHDRLNDEELRKNVEYIEGIYKRNAALEAAKAALEDDGPKYENIEIVDPDTFYQGIVGYEFFELDYYYNDGIVIDEEGDRMGLSIEELFGHDIRKEGGAHGAPADQVMVRNHNLERDYLVYLHEESYEDDLESLPGLGEEDDEE
jgi:hypothetical protein